MTDPQHPTYTCGVCGGTFTSDVSEADAQAEYTEIFGGSLDDAEPVCDTCWGKFWKWIAVQNGDIVRLKKGSR